jgi:hypothetical protein
MWFHRTQSKQPTLFLVIDDKQAALITWNHDHYSDSHESNSHATHPFAVKTYEVLPAEWFLHGVPWHVSSFTTYLQSYVTHHGLKKPLLVCACSGDTQYEKTISLAHTPTQAAIPPDTHYAHYAWHATSLPIQTHLPAATAHTASPITEPINIPITETTEQLPTSDLSSYLVSGMPHSDILRLRLCADKSGCTLHRMTTIRASMQPLYLYCQQHGITPENTQNTETARHTTPNQEPTHHATTPHTTDSSDTLLDMLCAPLPETHNRRLVLSALGLSLFERNNV